MSAGIAQGWGQGVTPLRLETAAKDAPNHVEDLLDMVEIGHSWKMRLRDKALAQGWGQIATPHRLELRTAAASSKPYPTTPGSVGAQFIAPHRDARRARAAGAGQPYEHVVRLKPQHATAPGAQRA